ncbi:MAG TPA: 30S ribosomal protein S17 [Patescibacteria group bacterium]|nr:30S ribosomal protein S17 [Patescibacteria group bacterium]
MKVFTGKVISKKMLKTATVSVERTVKHPMYQKTFTRQKKYHVHDDFDVAIGESVRFIASKPYSKLVRWKIVKDLKLKKVESNAKKPRDVAVKAVKKGRKSS